MGSLVRIPVVNRLRLGVVGHIGEPKDFPLDRLKTIAQVVHPFPALTPDMLKLAKWMSVYYAASLDGIIETMIPAAVRSGAGIKEEKLLSVAEKLAPDDLEALAKREPKQAQLYRFIEQQYRPQNKGLVLKRLNLTAAVSNALVKKGTLKEEARRVVREAYEDDLAWYWIRGARAPNARQGRVQWQGRIFRCWVRARFPTILS